MNFAFWLSGADALSFPLDELPSAIVIVHVKMDRSRVVDEEELMAQAHATISRLTAEVSQLREQLRRSEVDARTEKTIRELTVMSRVQPLTISSRDDGGAEDRAVLLERNQRLLVAVRRLEAQLAKRKTLCDELACEIKKASGQRAADLALVDELRSQNDSLKAKAVAAENAKVAAEALASKTIEQAEREVEKIRSATQSTIESLTLALQKSLDRQSALEQLLDK